MFIIYFAALLVLCDYNENPWYYCDAKAMFWKHYVYSIWWI